MKTANDYALIKHPQLVRRFVTFSIHSVFHILRRFIWFHLFIFVSRSRRQQQQQQQERNIHPTGCIWNQCMKSELVDKWMAKQQVWCWQIDAREWDSTAENYHARVYCMYTWNTGRLFSFFGFSVYKKCVKETLAAVKFNSNWNFEVEQKKREWNGIPHVRIDLIKCPSNVSKAHVKQLNVVGLSLLRHYSDALQKT